MALIFLKTLCRCVFTVFSLTKSLSAISILEAPLPSNLIICCSLLVNFAYICEVTTELPAR
ncbi:Uncharacterised protein [Vibrio cholerae]|nr:Uncharacterised protein [Vibrio cholerae]